MRAFWRWLTGPIDRLADLLSDPGDLTGDGTLESYEDELRQALRLADFLAVNDALPSLRMRMGTPWPRDDS